MNGCASSFAASSHASFSAAPSSAFFAGVAGVLGDRGLMLEGQRLARALVGDVVATNMFMLGYAVQRGFVPISPEALNKAIALKPKASAREQAYVDALATRYVEQPVEDRSQLDLAFVDAMRKVAATYPDDLDAATLYAESLMNQRPWALWSYDGKPYQRWR